MIEIQGYLLCMKYALGVAFCCLYFDWELSANHSNEIKSGQSPVSHLLKNCK